MNSSDKVILSFRINMATIRKYFTLCVLLKCAVEIWGQCEVDNIQHSMIASTGFRVTWRCYDPSLGDLRVSYWLTNKDQCDAEDALVEKEQNTEWGVWNREDTSNPDVYTHYADISNLYPYSTYRYTILSRYGALPVKQTGIYFVSTSEDAPEVVPSNIMLVQNAATATTLTFTFTEIPCGSRRGNTQYEFEVATYTDTPPHSVVSDAVVDPSTNNDGTVTVIISNLKSGTNFIFRVMGVNDNGMLPGPFSGGYTGATSAVIDSNECEPDPCVNGVCRDENNQYMCQCESGWTGINCDNSNECEPNPCVNGVCTDGNNQYTCQCDSGWTGMNCDNSNECEPNPCVNGVCTDGNNQYTCQCDSGWTGMNCDNSDECEPNPCVYGVCTDGNNQYTCQCDSGWTGMNCDNSDQCEPNPCVNGVCRDGNNQYTCQCDSGWTGVNCDDSKECEPDPCVNGVCRDESMQYTCQCESGWTGINCDNLNKCEPNPCANGVCTNGDNQYTCQCESGWTGEKCDNSNECEPNPCVNGVCRDGNNQYTCQCNSGWTGVNCDNSNECEPDPCVNGVCRDESNQYTCQCESGWTGINCDNVNECDPNPCNGNGKCEDGVNSYTCSCNDGWIGESCNENIDECASNPCVNGTCQDGINTYKCTCNSGWTGDICDNFDTPSTLTAVAPVIGGVVGGIIVLLILLIVVIAVRRRGRRRSQSHSDEDVPMNKHDEKTPPDTTTSHYDNPAIGNGMNGSPATKDKDETHFVNETPDKGSKPAPKPRDQTKTATLPAQRSPRVPRATIKNVSTNDDGESAIAKGENKSATLQPNASLPPKPTKPEPKPKPIKVADLPDYIAKKKQNRSEGFKKEFDGIPYDQQFPWPASQTEENIKRNRFKNIAAYDHSRVVLEDSSGAEGLTDYINAAYVKGYKDKTYIAGQGPNKLSIGDIWRMAWEQKSVKIVMLTNLVEQAKRKCEQYWTDSKQPFEYPPMRLRHMQTRKYADYTVRDFVLEKEGESEPREVRQFHFVSWPDMGLPEYPTPLINFLRIVNAYQPENTALPIIHCSAGVGRTGTFITLDAALQMAEAEKKVDINSIVRKLREDRINMVQTWEQYQFVYEAVQEALRCGDTGILVTNLRQGFSDLQNPDKKNKGKSKLESQFELLDELTVVPSEEQCHAGYSPQNVEKNRFKDKVPSEHRRAFLTVPGGQGSTDYINAGHLDGYVRQKEFMTTQMPMPNTVEDFWRMVYGGQLSTIVMLNGMSQTDPSLGVYWVEKGTLELTNLTVEFQSTKQYMDEVIGRTFKVYKTENPQTALTVQQFQFMDWPIGQDKPNSIPPLIAMTTLVEKWHQKQMKAHGARPIVVHCIDGMGVSGVYCALVSVLEKMKVEKVVDVFQSVKRLRMARPGMVENMEQYKFLYKAAQVSLEDLEIYENFR